MRVACPSSELIKLLCTRYAPYSNDSAFVRCRCEHGAGRVDGQEGDGRLVCLNHVFDEKLARAEDDDIPRLL